MEKKRVSPLCSVDQIFALLKRNNPGITFNEDDVIEWVLELMQEMCIWSGTQEKVEVLPVVSFLAVLPCDVFDLHAVVEHDGTPLNCPADYVPASSEGVEGFTIMDAGESIVVNGITYVSAVARRTGGNSRPIDTAFRPVSGGFDSAAYLPYSIEGDNRMRLPIQFGYVRINYSGLPVCDRGTPLIPGDLKQACYWYTLRKILWPERLKGNIARDVWEEMSETEEREVASGRARYHQPNRNGMERILSRMTSFQRRLPGMNYTQHYDNRNFPRK